MNFLSKNIVFSKQQYTFSFLIIFILILLEVFITKPFSYLSNIIKFILIFVLMVLIFKNYGKAILYTFIIYVIYFIILYSIVYYALTRKVTENFEDGSENKEDSLRNELDSLLKKLEAQSKSGESIIDTSNLQKHTDKLKGKIELNENDVTPNEPQGIDTSAMKFDEEKTDPLKKAQMETYALIDTIGILKETVQSLNPVLSEGKKVMDLFQGLNLENNDGNNLASLFKK
jgi:hypothetical protein